MANRIGSSRHRSRQKMTKDRRHRGKISLRNYLQSFKPGDKVALIAEPAYQKGMHQLRLQGHIVEVTKRRGKCYEVSVDDKGKQKSLLVHPVHLKKVS
ncbi:MAG TPA: 50S ribosomal protein L21e [Candidatus Nanoarchaeia archaeon]|nr:50S ribosomal protein L21e [Candidatus Nanoarchaeia archaeon]